MTCGNNHPTSCERDHEKPKLQDEEIGTVSVDILTRITAMKNECVWFKTGGRVNTAQLVNKFKFS
jgi:hypothetical protein